MNELDALLATLEREAAEFEEWDRNTKPLSVHTNRAEMMAKRRAWVKRQAELLARIAEIDPNIFNN